jgi:hypothetical protein
LNNDFAKLEAALMSALRDAGRFLEQETVEQIAAILRANLQKGRVQMFVESSKMAPHDYVWLVMDKYKRLRPLLVNLQVDQSTEAITSLYEKMQLWAYNYLLQQGYPSDAVTTWTITLMCAQTAISLALSSSFPYDTDIEAWAIVFVRMSCKRYTQPE